MPKLPVSQVIPEIKEQLSQSNRLILQAPPGAGKTTLVPLALLDQPWLKDKKIIMLEPRRLATRNSAARMAQLLGEKVGETVGYQIRQDKCISKKTRILVVTEGILTRKLQADPELEGVALVIFDEYHERNINADLSLAFCLQSQELLNEDLKILLMSATLNTQALVSLLDAPLISSQGRSFPIDIKYQPENSTTSHCFPINQRHLTASVVQKTLEAVNTHEGNILIFLPGVKEIKLIEHELLNSLSGKQILISPLYGELSKQQQDQAICTPPHGQRKIVLATNIAETSLTIDGINVVIDSGLQKESSFNPGSGMNSLHTTMISLDSATQRSGRAGRLDAGICYRLWSQSQHKRLTAHQNAEILRSDLAPVILELAQWGIQDVDELCWLDLPPPGATAQAKDLLHNLQAIDEQGRITPHGTKMLSLGIHPRLAHMLLTAQLIGHETLSCLLAALLTEKDILIGQKTSDLTFRVTIMQQFIQNKSIDNSQINKHQCKQILKTSREFQQRLSRTRSNNKGEKKDQYHLLNQSITGVILAFAYPDRIAQLRNTTGNNHSQRYLLSNSKGAFFSHYDPLDNEPFLVIPSLNEQTNQQLKEARIFLASSISQTQLEEYFLDIIHDSNDITWNKKLQKVDCYNKTMLGSIVLKEQKITSTAAIHLQPTLLSGIKNLGLNCLPWSKQAENLKQRIEFIRYQKNNNASCKELLSQIDLPDFSDSFLLDHLDKWLQPHLSNETSIKKLQGLDLKQILSANISWQTMQAIDELAPEKIQVPSGSQITIDYSEPDSPILAVRLQELFGLRTTPALLKNSYPLLLHLLSPASRPMQVTHDLASFWENTYEEVKKELRGKYKKHYWPDDPLQAQATNRVKPRKR